MRGDKPLEDLCALIFSNISLIIVFFSIRSSIRINRIYWGDKVEYIIFSLILQFDNTYLKLSLRYIH